MNLYIMQNLLDFFLINAILSPSYILMLSDVDDPSMGYVLLCPELSSGSSINCRKNDWEDKWGSQLIIQADWCASVAMAFGQELPPVVVF
jgi:hypothetical protein